MQEQFGYVYDASGNLNYRTNNTLSQQFNVNSLNELTTVTNGGRLTVAGSTTSPATNVTVNTLSAILYVDNTFASTNQTWANGNNSYTAVAKDSYGRTDSTTSSSYLLATNFFAYDLNGNLLTNGTRTFEYDDENQLIAVWVTNTWKSEFTYDGKMRRRIRKEYTWSGSAWLQTNEVHYVYDGNLVIQERDGNNLPQVTYTRGRDLSGYLQKAGGIGGLLARTDMEMLTSGSALAHAFYHADGNGNVTFLIYSNQSLAAKYEYDPYGNILSKAGTLAEANLYRFSSKEYHAVSAVICYLYRYYYPSLQRWGTKDPLNDCGSTVFDYIDKNSSLLIFFMQQRKSNGFEFVRNSPGEFIDRFGLQAVGWPGSGLSIPSGGGNIGLTSGPTDCCPPHQPRYKKQGKTREECIKDREEQYRWLYDSSIDIFTGIGGLVGVGFGTGLDPVGGEIPGALGGAAAGHQLANHLNDAAAGDWCDMCQ